MKIYLDTEQLEYFKTPTTGYSLAKAKFPKRHATAYQIIYALTKLGLITCCSEQNSLKGGIKKLYVLTEKGKTVLEILFEAKNTRLTA